MALIAASIPNLINGVSQQPYAMRLATQAEDQVNGDSSVSEGLRKRPATRYITKLMSSLATNALPHTINRDTVERYEVFFTGTTIRVFDMAGVEKTVNFEGSALAYITNSDPRTNFSVLTVADYTFIVNKTVEVEKGATKTPARTPQALVWIRTGDYKKKYIVKLNGSENAYTTLKSDDASGDQAESIQTDKIANELCTMINSGTWETERDGSVFTVNRIDDADFNIKVRDSLGDQGMVLVKEKIQRFNMLPDKAIGGFLCKVVGSDDEGFTDYYVQYEADPGTTGQVWTEAAAPDEFNSLNSGTMPHILVRESDGTFTCRAATWDTRTVGDLESDPMPTFVGREIRDVFFHRNRLGFLTDENIVMSADGEFFRFFKESVVQVLDTDPIDVAVSHTKVSILQHAVSHQDDLVLFATGTQFRLGTPELLTPKTVSVLPSSEYDVDPVVKPVTTGSNIYFMQNKGEFAAVRELFIDKDTQATDAIDITSHVPHYLSSNVRKLATCESEGMMIALPNNESYVWVYRQYRAGQNKVQSAWFRWTLPGTTRIRDVEFIETTLYLVVEREGGVYLEQASIEDGYRDGIYEPFMLDNMVKETQCSVSYNSTTDVTTITLPSTYLSEDEAANYKLISWYADATYSPGERVAFTRVDADTITCEGELTKFRFGRTYEFTYQFSTLIRRENLPGGSQEARTAERLQLRKMEIAYADTGYFEVRVKPNPRKDTEYVYKFTGSTLGVDMELGTIPSTSGSFRFPILARNIDASVVVKSSSHLPVRLLSAEWEAVLHNRARRV
jgi:hypothetical protein